VTNSYDADAVMCLSLLIIKDETIILEDDGKGMTIQISHSIYGLLEKKREKES